MHCPICQVELKMGDRQGNQPRRRRREGVFGEILDIFG
jgi:hypothetical protein